MVVMLKKQLQRVLHWRAVFTFNGMVILSARGAYAGLSQASRCEQQCAGLVLSNRYAALEPDAELPTDDEEEELVSASEEEEEELVPVSDDEEQLPRNTQPATLAVGGAGQQQGRRHSQGSNMAAQQRRHRPSRAPVQPGNSGLLCGVLNVNNMPKAELKLVEIHHLLKESRCDIMGFVETKEAQGKQLPADHIPGYTYISKPRVVRAGERASGGVAVAV
jgi:hypothetical protein